MCTHIVHLTPQHRTHTHTCTHCIIGSLAHVAFTQTPHARTHTHTHYLTLTLTHTLARSHSFSSSHTHRHTHTHTRTHLRPHSLSPPRAHHPPKYVYMMGKIHSMMIDQPLPVRSLYFEQLYKVLNCCVHMYVGMFRVIYMYI